MCSGKIQPKLDWDGKRTEVERVELPFQLVEVVNEPRAKTMDMFVPKIGGDKWYDMLIWGDNKLVMNSLIGRGFAGKINLIYIDPPFATGADFVKEVSGIKVKVYRDTWSQGLASYLQMIYDRLVLMRELLSEKGSVYVHMDWHAGHYVKVIMDEIFGRENFRREIIWVMTGLAGYKALVENYVRAHDVILYYSKSNNCIFNKIYLPYNEKQLARFSSVDEKGRRYKPITKTRRLYLDEAKGIPIPDVWSDIVGFHTIMNAKDFLGFPTQKPESLLERIVKASSNEGDLVADFFCGSGTTLAVAEKLGRRWIGADLSKFAINLSRKRLLEIPGCHPFQILNLGRYHKQKLIEDVSSD